MNTRLKRYKKGTDHSYTFGVFPTLELLRHRQQDVLTILIHPKGEANIGIQKIFEICQLQKIPFEIDTRVFNRLGARENDYAIGVFKVVKMGLNEKKDHVVLVNPSGRGNLGTIIRTILGFDFQDLAIIQPAVDIFHPDVIRASMGALFQVRFEYFSDFSSYEAKHPRNFYPLMTDGELILPRVGFNQPFGLIFGNESSGLTDEFRQIGTSVAIPQSHKIDSLNLATSVAVTLYQVNLNLERISNARFNHTPG
jgi:TrmH family RNA methyltransferase